MDIDKFNSYLNKMNTLRERVIEDKTHRHHIIPKCMGGDDSDENIVNLTIDEHIAAHIELANCFELGNTERNKNLSAANVLHVWINKKSDIDISGCNNPMWGKTHSEKAKKQIGKKSKQKVYTLEYRKKLSMAFMGERNHRYGIKLSDETRKKIGDAQKGELHHLWGKKRSDSTKKKIGQSQPSRVKISKYDLNYNKLETYDSISEAATSNNISPGNLSGYFTKSKITKYGSYRMLGGFIWVRE